MKFNRDVNASMRRGASPSAMTALCLTILLGINIYICADLFRAEFTQRMESIEGPFISISNYAMKHWGDLTWFPLWFTGMPFHQVYQPGLHLTVAAVGTVLHQSPQHAYHIVTALTYCLGPVTLFLLCWHATGWRGWAFVVGLVYSLVSVSCFLLPAIRNDVGGLLFSRRYQVLVHYGEGPHTTGLMLIPLVIYCVDLAVTQRRWFFVPIASAALAAVVLTNWPSSVGLTMAVIAYCLSKIGSPKPLHWPTLIGLAIVAYLVACPWIPPSTVMLVERNAQLSDATMFGRMHALDLLAVIAVLAGFHRLFSWLRVPEWLRFFLFFSFLSGVVAMGKEWGHVKLLPQPSRFQMEMEMGLTASLVYLAKLAHDRFPKWARLSISAILVVCCFFQVKHVRRYARNMTQPIDIATTIEYRMAKWFDAHMQGRRVFAPGNVSLWMSVFTEVPEVDGCCDQGVPNQMRRIAGYTIYSGENAGPRDPEISLLWLRAYGAHAVGVTGPRSSEYFKPFRHPEKFVGVLPQVWRNDDDAIFEIPSRSPSLAHVLERSQLVWRKPENGLDVAPLIPYVSALENPGMPIAEFRWKSQHEARIDAELRRGQVVSVQVSYDRGWRALVNGAPRPVMPDALGLTVIEPDCNGECKIDLTYDGGVQAKAVHYAAGLGGFACVAWTLAEFRKSRLRKSVQSNASA